ncbi:hypothetical protein GCM10009768_06240 [Leucobacter iarius]|uniref:Uncharacterized protein n=1 Tax=Leucobacter iarius TaxID=333963 RepID=A0ABN2L960_9MICO
MNIELVRFGSPDSRTTRTAAATAADTDPSSFMAGPAGPTPLGATENARIMRFPPGGSRIGGAPPMLWTPSRF